MARFCGPAAPGRTLRSRASPGQQVNLGFGDQEKIYDPRRAVRRAERLMPHVESALIPNAGHLPIMEQPEAVNERILAFLTPSSGMSKLKDGEAPRDEKNIERVAIG